MSNSDLLAAVRRSRPLVQCITNYVSMDVMANILLAAQTGDWGPIQYAGELHDRATYRYFWEILQKARVTGVAIPDAAAKAFFP